MRLADLPLVVIEDMKRTWRRRLIAGVIVLFFGIAAIIEAIDAARLALAPAVGPVGARLILVGVFALIGAAAMGFVWWAERQKRAVEAQTAAASDAAAAAPPAGNEKIAMLAEAIHLGYSLARRLRGRPARRKRAAKETPRHPAEPAATSPEAAAATGQP